MNKLDCYRQVWLVDFEFYAPPGYRPTVLCMVAKEYKSQRSYRLWQEELEKMRGPPFAVDFHTLYVAYYSSAEFGCHIALDWCPATITFVH